jgi:hypothetical protein
MKTLKSLVLFVILNSPCFAQTIRYVKPTGSGIGNSWANASNDLQLMINQSSAGDEIWVAAGTYIRIRRMDNLGVISYGNRQNAFVAKSGVKIYGGFVGTETAISGPAMYHGHGFVINSIISLNDLF